MPSLDDVKVGDLVIFDGFSFKRIERVVKLTKTQITTNKGRYNKRNGHPIGGGGGYHSGYICAADEAELKKVHGEILHRRAASKLANTDWKKFPLETLQKVVEIVDSFS
jgi:hypothetical protein